MSTLRIAAVIPARLHSTRLDRKVLRILAGRPMVEWVWRAAAASGLMDPVVVATDAEEVAEVCRERGIPVVMTSPECASGSDRVREVARLIDADIYVNIQGDEPLLDPALVGLEASKARAQELVQMALDALERFDQRAEPLRAIASYIVKRKS